MSSSTIKPTPPGDGSLEFEVTDFTEARMALEELPAGLQAAGALRPNRWESKRRPRLPTDRALVGQTLEWILTLPEIARPKKLADMAPRIANAVAEYWNDPMRASAYIDDLLIDRRGGRRGLPPDVKEELQVLQQLLVNSMAQRSG